MAHPPAPDQYAERYTHHDTDEVIQAAASPT
jgi:hypothetical protein